MCSPVPITRLLRFQAANFMCSNARRATWTGCVMQQIVRAFGRVESAFQFLVLSWSTVVEMLSVYKRLRAFERQIKSGDFSGPGTEPASA